jgi:hypothetical protein
MNQARMAFTAALVFDEERRSAREMTAGREAVRESFFIPIPSV